MAVESALKAAGSEVISDTASNPIPATSRRLVMIACMLVMVLASMETTITSTAMPTIIGDLHGLEHYAWVAAIYLLTCTVSMPLYGRLADTLGRKRVLIASIVLFLLASVLASTAHSMGQLILYRGIQGLGAGGIMPIVLTVLGDIFSIEERAKVQGYFSAIWGTASLAGPALGALLVNTLGWRSIFFVNLPPGLIALAVLSIYYRDLHKPTSKLGWHHVDLPGFLTLSVATSALLVAVSLPFSVVLTPGLVVVSALAGFAFLKVERRTDEPLLSPDLMLRRDIWPSVVGSGLLGVGFLSLDTYVPLFVQGGRGGGATAAASVVTPVMLAWAISGIYAAPLVVKRGFRFTAIFGSSLMTVGFVGLLMCGIFELPTWLLTAVLMITGFGLGPASMSFLLSGQNAVDYTQRGVVTGAIQLSRTLGGALGIGLHGALFTLLSANELSTLTAQGYAPAALLSAETGTSSTLPPEILGQARHMISHNLLFVFASMLLFAAVQIYFASRVCKAKAEHKPRAAEAMEVG